MSKAYKRANELLEANRTAKKQFARLLAITLANVGIAGHRAGHRAGRNHQRPVEVFRSVGCTRGDAHGDEAIIHGLGNPVTPPRLGVGQGGLLSLPILLKQRLRNSAKNTVLKFSIKCGFAVVNVTRVQ